MRTQKQNLHIVQLRAEQQKVDKQMEKALFPLASLDFQLAQPAARVGLVCIHEHSAESQRASFYLRYWILFEEPDERAVLCKQMPLFNRKTTFAPKKRDT